jgi:hypothetical protein
MKILIMQFPPTSYHFISFFGQNILLNTLFSNTLSLSFSLNARDQVSHEYKTTGKIIFYVILIFKFLERKGKDKKICTLNGNKNYSNLIRS